VYNNKNMETIITDQNFEQEVLKADKMVLVDFFAIWCPPCQAMKPLVAKFAEEYKDKVKVCLLNVDENPAMSQQYGVQSIPTFIFFKDGKEVERFMGAVPFQTLVDRVK